MENTKLNKFKRNATTLIIGAAIVLANIGCESKPNSQIEKPGADGKGIGPVKSVTLGQIDSALAEIGKTKFEAVCTSCHKLNEKYIGPTISGVTKRRKPEWIMNMILNPTEMLAKDSTAKKLLAEFISPMANQNLTEEEARAVLEYFRTIDLP